MRIFYVRNFYFSGQRLYALARNIEAGPGWEINMVGRSEKRPVPERCGPWTEYHCLEMRRYHEAAGVFQCGSIAVDRRCKGMGTLSSDAQHLEGGTIS